MYPLLRGVSLECFYLIHFGENLNNEPRRIIIPAVLTYYGIEEQGINNEFGNI